MILELLKKLTQLCDIIIYNRKYILDLHLISGTNSYNPWNFPSDESSQGILCYVTEVCIKTPYPLGKNFHMAHVCMERY